MKTILVVDEDSKVKNLFRLMFTEGMGYRVVAISSPTEAILKAKETKPDVVFVNASSSNQNGYRVSKEIKNKRLLKDIPVVLLTQASLPLKEKEILESRADDIIAKPFEPQEIIKKVESLTTKQKEQLQAPVDQEVKRKTAFFEIGVVLLIILTIAIPITYKAFDINSSKVQSTLNSLHSRLMNFGDVNISTIESKPVAYDERKKEVIYDIKNEDSEKSELNTNVLYSSKASGGETSVKKGKLSQPETLKTPELKKAKSADEILHEVNGEKPKEIVTASLSAYLDAEKRKNAFEDTAQIPRKEKEVLEKTGEKETVENKESKAVEIAPIPETQPDGKYSVQVGAFQEEEEVQRITKGLISKEYPVFIRTAEIPGKGTWHMIRVGTFRTREEAEAYGDSLRSREPLAQEAIVVSEIESENKRQISYNLEPDKSSNITSSSQSETKKPSYDEERYRIIEEIKRQRVLNDIEKSVQEKEIVVVETKRKEKKVPTLQDVHRIIEEIQNTLRE